MSDVSACPYDECVSPEQIGLPQSDGLRGNFRDFLARDGAD